MNQVSYYQHMQRVTCSGILRNHVYSSVPFPFREIYPGVTRHKCSNPFLLDRCSTSGGEPEDACMKLL